MRIVILLCALMMVGCTSLTPNKAAAITSDVLDKVAVEVDQAQKLGYITDAEENALIDKLIGGQKLLLDLTVPGRLSSCADGQTKQECLQVILEEVTAKLREAQTS